MTNPFVGEIRAFSFAFAPTGWMLCNGQLLPINQYQALFALLGTTYGGNGTQNFGLPDLRGRVAQGVSPNYPQGAVAGVESVTLLMNQMPTHTHAVNAAANGQTGGGNIPGPTVVLGSGYSNQSGDPTVAIYDTTAPGTGLLPLGLTGSSQPHENRMPLLAINYCIAYSGIFPSRP